MGTKPARTLGATLAIVAFALAGCGASEPEREAGETIEHPRGAEDVVLRVEERGSYAPLSWQLRERLPLFTLYGDGRAIAQLEESPVEPTYAVPPLVERRLSRDGIEAVSRAARRAGLQGPDRNYDDVEVTDLPTTTFTLASGGGTHVTTAYGLVELRASGEGVPAGEREARTKLLELRSALLDLGRWLPDAATGPARPYRYEALLVFVLPEVGDVEVVEDAAGDTAPEAEWPLAVALADFGEPLADMPDVRCGLVEGSELERVRGPAEGAGVYARWRSGKTVRLLAFRPLLPGGPACPGP